MEEQNTRRAEKIVDQATRHLKSGYKLVSNHGLNSWYIWAFAGAMVGVIVAVSYVSNQRFAFNDTEAAKTPTVTQSVKVISIAKLNEALADTAYASLRERPLIAELSKSKNGIFSVAVASVTEKEIQSDTISELPAARFKQVSLSDARTLLGTLATLLTQPVAPQVIKINDKLPTATQFLVNVPLSIVVKGATGSWTDSYSNTMTYSLANMYFGGSCVCHAAASVALYCSANGDFPTPLYGGSGTQNNARDLITISNPSLSATSASPKKVLITFSADLPTQELCKLDQKVACTDTQPCKDSIVAQIISFNKNNQAKMNAACDAAAGTEGKSTGEVGPGTLVNPEDLITFNPNFATCSAAARP